MDDKYLKGVLEQDDFDLFPPPGDFSFLANKYFKETLAFDYKLFFTVHEKYGYAVLKQENKDFSSAFWKFIKSTCHPNHNLDNFKTSIYVLSYIAKHGWSEFTIKVRNTAHGIY